MRAQPPDIPERWAELATGPASEAGDGSFWVTALRREEQKVNAACRALGGLEYFTGAEFTGTPRDRMRHIREVVAELRVELGMPRDPLSFAATADEDAFDRIERNALPGGEAA